MPAPTQPSEIAREVLRLFAARRIPPTPDNFRKLYHEVAGTPLDDGPFPLSFVKSLARQIPRDTAERTRLARQLDQALADENPDAGKQALAQYLVSLKLEQAPVWNDLIANLLRQWEARQIGWTTARKRESLERVLTANDPATLYARLQGLVRSWAQLPIDPETPSAVKDGATSAVTSSAAETADVAAPEIRHVSAGEAGELLATLRELLLLTLESVVPAFLGDHPELASEAAGFARAAKTANGAGDLRTLTIQLRKFAYRLEMSAGDSAEINAGLLNLLRLLLENIDQLVIDDHWLHGQIEVLREIVGKSANVRVIDEAERRIKEVIYKQSQLKHNHSEAQRSLREMLAGFVDHLASFAETTSTYHDRIGECADKISAARDITEISGVLGDVMRETVAMRDEARRSRDELQAARERAREAEARMNELQQQLDETSRLMRHDQLTGVLNRRGLEETFDRESARARRHGNQLSVALLDLDNFKKLNDTYGHQIGDEALIHLTSVVRNNLRPQDTVARHGGEEFILLYPDTALDQAQAALIRLQRELTRNFFLADEKKLLITFSAGVTEWNREEAMDAVLDRADKAMYQAKQTGKNKVVAFHHDIDAPQRE
jgi:diguanylate cyclase